MTEGNKVLDSLPPWTDEMHEKWLKELKEMRTIVVFPKEGGMEDLPEFSEEWKKAFIRQAILGEPTVIQFKDNAVQSVTPLDFIPRGKQLLKELLDEQQEVISSPIRFNGVHIEKIKQIFEKYGIRIEQEF